ncbi:MACPF domain-containing protein At1g14780-like [Phragmites australis]|uniref:MACPF domain-containing protein At1g14780-like n=1 Tax=Phragmites australis TaxID=29695 RepID=UPI002D7A3A70|nr:MACPF domain-containing protein At1g14780-like [Phragmites australis]
MAGGDGAAAAAVEKVVRCLGRGVDMTGDLRLKHCKDAGGCLVVRSGKKAARAKTVAVPGVGFVAGVPDDVKFGKGDRIKFKSDVLEFNKMSDLFNHRNSLTGKIPSGLFNSCFDLDCSSWAQDASATKCLAFDGYFISLLDLRLDCRPLTLADHVVRDVPVAWDPSAIASFIKKYGTHIVVGLSLGGQDVVYVKQDKSSPLSPSEIKGHLDRLGDQLFTGTCTLPPSHCKSRDHKFKVPQAFNVFDAQVTQQRIEGITTLMSCKEGVTVMYSKRGGDTGASNHSEWLLTVPTMPDAINFKLVPITSLLNGVSGGGFLSHAMNLYLRYKPPIADLRYFLDFQHHRLWAPVLSDLPLGPCSNRQGASPALHFSLGSKLYVSSSQVIVPILPVTGMRLHLEGKKNNRLGIHLQHFSNTPTFINGRSDKPPVWRGSEMISDERYYEPVQWRMFAHVCTVPVRYDPRWRSADPQTAYIVSGAQLHVKAHDSTNILHLRLLYTELLGYTVVQSKWAHNTVRLSGKGSFLSKSFAASSGAIEREQQQPARAHIDSGVFAGGPPVPVGTQRLLKFVETSQVTMGPQDSPGYWLVTGAKLDVGKGKILLHVKFSLLAPVS